MASFKLLSRLVSCHLSAWLLKRQLGTCLSLSCGTHTRTFLTSAVLLTSSLNLSRLFLMSSNSTSRHVVLNLFSAAVTPEWRSLSRAPWKSTGGSVDGTASPVSPTPLPLTNA